MNTGKTNAQEFAHL